MKWNWLHFNHKIVIFSVLFVIKTKISLCVSHLTNQSYSGYNRGNVVSLENPHLMERKELFTIWTWKLLFNKYGQGSSIQGVRKKQSYFALNCGPKTRIKLDTENSKLLKTFLEGEVRKTTRTQKNLININHFRTSI